MIRMGQGTIGRLLGCLTLEQLSRLSGGIWNPDSLAAGLLFTSMQNTRADVFHSLYEEDERQMDPGKRLTGMAAFLQKKPSDFYLIIPGGGYNAVATIQEGFPVAQALFEKGYSGFVLQYRTGKYAAAPHCIEDVARAVEYICIHSAEWQLNMDHYGLVGFSAGGHLAACFSSEKTSWSTYGIPRPETLILGYPVVTMGEYAHEGSRDILIGKHPRKEDIDRYSVEKQITSFFPRTYLWQCDRDRTVSVENSKLLASALERNGIACRYITYPSDAHGWGVGTGTAAEGWLDEALLFLNGFERSCNDGDVL